MAEFWAEAWPHPDPRPTLLHDPRTLGRTWHARGGYWYSPVSMHAKCLVVDREQVLIGSANFTRRAQSDNVEVGVLVHDPELADGLLHQWRSAISEGLIRPVRPDL